MNVMIAMTTMLDKNIYCTNPSNPSLTTWNVRDPTLPCETATNGIYHTGILPCKDSFEAPLTPMLVRSSSYATSDRRPPGIFLEFKVLGRLESASTPYLLPTSERFLDLKAASVKQEYLASYCCAPCCSDCLAACFCRTRCTVATGSAKVGSIWSRPG